MIRCGNGYDAHRLAPDRRLVLGGVEIPHDRGLEGHSDADVLCHAIADALLGAIGESDIGHHFPNTDESIRGISSLEILRRVTSVLARKNARPVNVDATLIAEAPKIAPHIPAMREKIAAALESRNFPSQHQGHDERRARCHRPRRRHGRDGGGDGGDGVMERWSNAVMRCAAPFLHYSNTPLLFA